MDEKRKKAAMLIITLGIVYGDIGTSPLYVMSALLAANNWVITPEYILGCLSLVIWTITLVTTVKYIVFVLRADNHGEGGIFSLYTLVKKRKRWLMIVAMIGGAALLADSIITPALTITSAVEGLKMVPNQEWAFIENTRAIMAIVIFIITIIFLIQRNGTSFIGKLFGPIMLVWFIFLGLIGVHNIIGNVEIFKAINPYYAINMLFNYQGSSILIVLGSVFLATTGAEALYSDLGHVGKKNIYATWPFVKCMLLLNYFGQCAWILTNSEQVVPGTNPFFACMPPELILFGVLLATAAAIIASQSLISGAFTLVSEGIALNLLPRLKILYPSTSKGQVYIPFVAFVLWLGSVSAVLLFQTAAHMEAAYGLAITITMLMTTTLLMEYLASINYNKFKRYPIIITFFIIEITFFTASLLKIAHGGYFTLTLTLLFATVMVIWVLDKKIKHKYINRQPISLYEEELVKLSKDTNYPKAATNLVYLTFAKYKNRDKIDVEIASSILDSRPKRADVYWIVSLQVTHKPYGCEYDYKVFGDNNIVSLQLFLGFCERQSIPHLMEGVISELIDKGVIAKQSNTYTINQYKDVGDMKYIAIRELVNGDANITKLEHMILNTRISIQDRLGNIIDWYDLKYSNYEIEYVPINLPVKSIQINKVDGQEVIDELF